VQVGQEIEAHVAQVDGRAGGIVLRVRAGRGALDGEALREAFENGVPVEGLVTGVNKGGVEVLVAGARAFCPISQLDAKRVEDASVFVGKKLTFRVSRFEPGPRGRPGNVVLNRRVIAEEEQRARAAEARARLETGAVVRGKVTQIRDYGAFVDLGGVEGMLHVSEFGFARVQNPRDVLAVGQEVEVQILRIETSTGPKRSDRISLSLKSLEKDPWLDVPERFPAGTRVRGKVARVEAFGAFVELAPGIEGLVHVSELSGGRPVKHAREVVKPGQEMDVVVNETDVERRRISLSQAGPDDEPWEPQPKPLDDGPRDTLGGLLEKSGRKPR